MKIYDKTFKQIIAGDNITLHVFLIHGHVQF